MIPLISSLSTLLKPALFSVLRLLRVLGQFPTSPHCVSSPCTTKHPYFLFFIQAVVQSKTRKLPNAGALYCRYRHPQHHHPRRALSGLSPSPRFGPRPVSAQHNKLLPRTSPNLRPSKLRPHHTQLRRLVLLLASVMLFTAACLLKSQLASARAFRRSILL